ncbi:response regulator receiver domain [uncultured Christiangramia sp.]|uniref:response regulator receiver domain n=1 Tax=uncultured Christiangramia sp. TaxID=503836 RepID=UPI00261A5318|nr:response regulator receiver domain [uncultured Christiangramia sp.]
MESQVNTGLAHNQIPSRIVRNAIRSAICIDDNYAAPYRNSEGLNSEQPEKLYYSFRKDGKCDLDIYRFQGLEEWKKHKHLLCNKDLMVLDWELDQTSKNKYSDTLEILKHNMRVKNVPFVVIYTQTQDLDNVSKTLLEEFNNYNEADYGKLISLFTREFKEFVQEQDELESFLEENSDFFYEFIKSYGKRNELFSEFRNNFFLKFGIKEKFIFNYEENCRSKGLSGDSLKGCINAAEKRFERECFPQFEEKIKKISSNFQECNNHLDGFIEIANVNLCNDIKEGDSLEVKNNRIHIEKHCYSLGGIIVLILHKKGEEDGVNPDDLFNVFSEAITSNPHNLLHLISLELKDKFRNDFSTIGTKFNTVDEQAFLYHAKNYETDGEFNLNSFKNFVVKSWIHELSQYNLDLSLNSFDLIEELIKEYEYPNNEQFHIALAEYAAMVSCVILKNRSNHKLGFGNLFKSGDNYFLCITPHCDCLRPSKINNEFYFIYGEETKIKTALNGAETGYFSFCMVDNKPITIEWQCKPFSSYFSDDSNSEKEKNILFKTEKFPLEYVCTIKENYAQRISNNSFGHGYRIGIDLPHLKNE